MLRLNSNLRSSAAFAFSFPSFGPIGSPAAGGGGSGGLVTQTAYFGTLTLSGEGGYKPLGLGGIELDVVSIIAGGDLTPTPSVSDGRLVFLGTGAPNNGTVTVATTNGDVEIIIRTVPGRSVDNPQQLGNATWGQRTGTAPLTIYMRPGAYDVNNNGNTTSGIFHTRWVPEVAVTTITRHPNQTDRPYFFKADPELNSYWYSTSWLVFEGVDFAFPSNGAQMITTGSTTTDLNRTRHITFRDVRWIGPEIPQEALYDNVSWPDGYGTAYPGRYLGVGPKLNYAYNITLEDCVFENLSTCGDYNTEGLVMINVESRRNYGDAFRLSPQPRVLPYIVPCILYRVRSTGFFGVNNELFATTGQLAPHNDYFQVIGGTALYVVWEQCWMTRGDYRGDVVQSFQQNSTMDRATYHQCVALNKGSTWGRNDEGSRWNLINHCTFTTGDMNGSTSIRFGGGPSNKPAEGDMRIRNTYIGSTNGNPVTILHNNVTDPARIVNENSYFAAGTRALDHLKGPADPTLETIFESCSPIPGELVDTDGLGALETDGTWRNVTFPPLPGQPPTLTQDGNGNVVISVTPSMYVGRNGSQPGSWEWTSRPADYESWSEWTPATGTSTVAVGRDTPGHRFMYRYVSTDGVAGVPSLIVSLPGEPPALESPNLLDLSQPAQTTASDEFITEFNPLRVTSVGTATATNTSRGGWTFEAVAGTTYLVTWSYDTLGDTSAGAAVRVTADPAMGSTGAIYSSTLATSGSVTITPTTSGLRYVGPALRIPAGQTITINELSVQVFGS